MSSLPSDITVPGRPEVHEVSDGVFAYVQPDGTWWINNTGFLVGPQGVVASTPARPSGGPAPTWPPSPPVTTAPVRTVVNTHHHGDHTFGNCLFPAATIVGHEQHAGRGDRLRPAARARRSGTNPDWGELAARPAVPHLHRRGRRCTSTTCARRCRHVGTPAHTTNDSIVWIPGALRAVLRRPGVQRRHAVPADGLGRGGDRGAGAGRGAARRRTIVPGHGPVFDGDGADRGDAGLPPVRARRRGPRPGRRADPARRRPATPTSAGSPTGRTPSGSSATCTGPTPSSTATPRGGPIDISAALGRHGHLQRRRAADLPGLTRLGGAGADGRCPARLLPAGRPSGWPTASGRAAALGLPVRLLLVAAGLLAGLPGPAGRILAHRYPFRLTGNAAAPAHSVTSGPARNYHG